MLWLQLQSDVGGRLEWLSSPRALRTLFVSSGASEKRLSETLPKALRAVFLSHAVVDISMGSERSNVLY